MPERAPKGRSVKSAPGQGAAGAADGHERAKDFLTAAELAALLEAAKAGRHGVRDHLLLMMMFRHGLRVSEAVSLRLDELDLDRSMLWVHRLKGGLSVQQPIAGDELCAVRRYLAVRRGELPWRFLSERGQPLTRQAVSYLVGLAAERAGLPGRPCKIVVVITLPLLLATGRRWRAGTRGGDGGRRPRACCSAPPCARLGRAAP